MLIDFQIFFNGRFTSKYATKSSLTIPPHLKGVAELPCETSVSENSENLMHASLSGIDHHAKTILFHFRRGSVLK